MTSVFLDTVGLIALWDESDQWHESAQRAFDLFTPKASVRLVTTTFVLLECGNASARRAYRKDVADLWNALDRTSDLIRPSEVQLTEAWSRYASGQPGSAGIVDHVSFVVMRELDIAAAFTNDAHFRAEGFETLMK